MLPATLDSPVPLPQSSQQTSADYGGLVCGTGLPVARWGSLPVNSRRCAWHLQNLRTRSGSDPAADLDQLVSDLARAAEENRQRKLYGRSQDSASNPWTAGENA